MEYKDRNGISTNKTILDIYEMLKSEKLVLQPAFQRKLVWNIAHKEAFIESILYGYPFPEVYFANGNIDVESLSSQNLVVDGQQRLDTIYKYISGDVSLTFSRIKPFKLLEKDEKERFLQYKVVVRDLGNASIDEIREIFKRINSVNYALNAIEIDHALYDGDYISTAKDLLDNKIFEKFNVFTQTDSDRMKDLEFILNIMTTVEIGSYYSNSVELESFIKQYDDLYPKKDSIKGIFFKIKNLLNDVQNLEKTIWNTKAGSFTLFCELGFLYSQNKEIKNPKKISQLLENFNIDVRNSKEGEKYFDFSYFLIQGTGTKTGRIKRGTLLRERLNEIL